MKLKMKNKINLKKVIIYSIIVIFLFNIVFAIINFVQYKVYTRNFNNKLNILISILNEKYPNIEKNNIIEILNSNNVKSDFLLKSYGIDLSKDSVILENDNYFRLFSVINAIIIFIAMLTIFIIFLYYNHKKDMTIQEITKYIEEINRRNYKLDIEDNTEDELSILKNEIYKTTIMLKEVAENYLNDKINLKESLSDISHQLKTPLTSIIIMLDNLLDNKDMEKDLQIQFIQKIKREISNINFLISSLLKLSKFDVNAINFINKDEYIQDILELSIKNVSVLSDLKNVNINITGNEDIKINCDIRWQVEAITNILKNCVEHSFPFSTIYISFEQNKLYSKIEIKDCGSGIAQKDLPHIFERFYKGKNTSDDGVGIGLALSKSIIEKNNGYVYVDSKLNEGTCFTIKYMC